MTSSLPEWEAVNVKMAEAIKNYYSNRPDILSSPSIEGTIRTNTDLTPARRRMLETLAEDIGVVKVPLFKDRDVLEVGSGFGALGLNIAIEGKARSVRGVELNERLVTQSQSVSDALGLGGMVRFTHTDARYLYGIPDESFDVIVCNNTLYYIHQKEDAQSALAAMRRVLRKGGFLVIFQANKWRYNDAFTKAPLVQVMPRWLADYVCRIKGWQHSHGRIDFMSLPDIKRRLRRAGFDHVRQSGIAHGKALKGFNGLFTDYIFTVAY